MVTTVMVVHNQQSFSVVRSILLVKFRAFHIWSKAFKRRQYNFLHKTQTVSALVVSWVFSNFLLPFEFRCFGKSCARPNECVSIWITSGLLWMSIFQMRPTIPHLKIKQFSGQFPRWISMCNLCYFRSFFFSVGCNLWKVVNSCAFGMLVFFVQFFFLLWVHASKSISRPACCSRSKVFNQHKSIFSTLFGIRCEILNLMRIALSMRYAIHFCIIYLFQCSFHAHLHSYFMYIGESFMLCNFGKREICKAEECGWKFIREFCTCSNAFLLF